MSLLLPTQYHSRLLISASFTKGCKSGGRIFSPIIALILSVSERIFERPLPAVFDEVVELAAKKIYA